MSMFVKNIRRARWIGRIYELMGGNRIGFRRIAHPRKRVKTPQWMYNDLEIRSFLLRIFPHLVDGWKPVAPYSAEYIGVVIPEETKRQQYERKRGERQNRTASRWGFVIKNFFTGTMSSRDIEFEWRHPTGCKCVTRLIQRIRRAGEGLRQDGRPRTGNLRGRPPRLSHDAQPAPAVELNHPAP
jgi:hypothetical protein